MHQWRYAMGLGLLLSALTATALAGMPAEAPEAATDGAEAVERGRQALDGWVDYNWYDDATDGVRRVDVKPPRNWNTNWSFELPPGALRVVLWAFVAAFLLVVIWLLWKHFRESEVFPSRIRKAEESDRARIESLPFPVDGRRHDLLEEARRLYEAGRYGQAIVYLFSYQLVHLDRQQIIRLARGKTNRQYLREVGSSTRLHGLVEDTMVAFEDVYFGQHPLERSRFESHWSRVGEFQTLAAAMAPSAA